MSVNPLIVAICTYRRPSVVATIRSVFVQTRKPDGILVIDNDTFPSARPPIDGLRDESDIPLVYEHIPGRNIALARNACLEHVGHGRIAFLDDDETAHPGWLARLEDELTDDVAATFGPQLAKYSSAAPAWMQVLSPHTFRGYTIEGQLKAGSTGNCLINLDHPAIAGRRFSVDIAPYGGSDTLYFYNAHRDGARYRFVGEAVVSETVPPARARWSWLLRRRYRVGHTFAVVTEKKGVADATIAAAKLLACAGMAVLRAFDPVASRAAVLRGALHAGVIAACFGRSPRPEYGPVEPANAKR